MIFSFFFILIFPASITAIQHLVEDSLPLFSHSHNFIAGCTHLKLFHLSPVQNSIVFDFSWLRFHLWLFCLRFARSISKAINRRSMEQWKQFICSWNLFEHLHQCYIIINSSLIILALIAAIEHLVKDTLPLLSHGHNFIAGCTHFKLFYLTSV